MNHNRNRTLQLRKWIVYFESRIVIFCRPVINSRQKSEISIKKWIPFSKILHKMLHAIKSLRDVLSNPWGGCAVFCGGSCSGRCARVRRNSSAFGCARAPLTINHECRRWFCNVQFIMFISLGRFKGLEMVWAELGKDLLFESLCSWTERL